MQTPSLFRFLQTLIANSAYLIIFRSARFYAADLKIAGRVGGFLPLKFAGAGRIKSRPRKIADGLVFIIYRYSTALITPVFRSMT